MQRSEHCEVKILIRYDYYYVDVENIINFLIADVPILVVYFFWNFILTGPYTYLLDAAAVYFLY